MNPLPYLELLAWIALGLIANLVLTIIVIAVYYNCVEQGENHKK